jgi:hypothetical protein
MVSADRPDSKLCARAKNSALALVLWHDGDVATLALARSAGAMAPGGTVRLLQSDHCRVGALGHCFLGWGPSASGERASIHMESRLFPSQALHRHSVLPFCVCGSPADARAGTLNGFGLWNVLVLFLMVAAYGWPIAQFFVLGAPQAVVHRVDRGG